MTEPAIYFDTDHADDRAFADDLDNLAADRGFMRWPGENDAELRERLASGLYPMRGTRDAIEQALLRIQGVRHVNITEVYDARDEMHLEFRVDVASRARLVIRDAIMLEIRRQIAAGVQWVLELECEERDRGLLGDYDVFGMPRGRGYS